MKIRQGNIHIIFLQEDIVILSKKKYKDWLEIQDDYEHYMTSLGPWTTDAIISFSEIDYGKDDSMWPFSRDQILSFSESNDEVTQSG